MFRGVFPTLGLLYSFLIPHQAPRSVLFHDSFQDESTWLDVFYDINPKGILRSGPIHFTAYVAKDGRNRILEGWQTMIGETPVYLVPSHGSLQTLAASDLPKALAP